MTTQTSDRLAELMLYVARQCVTHQLFGVVKLNKILYFADAKSFGERGATITRERFVKDTFGPVPKRSSQIIAELERSGAAVMVDRDMPDGTVQHRLAARRKPDLSLFDGNDIATVDQIIATLGGSSANEVSELSHESVGWESARMGEEIPWATTLIPKHPIPLSADETEYGESLAHGISN